MELRRVVVTGLGLVTPLGTGIEATWANILAGKSGAKRIDDFEVDDIAGQIAHRLPLGDYADGKYNPDEWMDTKEQRKVDPFIVFAMAASTQAIDDAGVEPKTQEEAERTGVLIGSGIGGVGGIYDASITLHEKGPRRISPFFSSALIITSMLAPLFTKFASTTPKGSAPPELRRAPADFMTETPPVRAAPELTTGMPAPVPTPRVPFGVVPYQLTPRSRSPV